MKITLVKTCDACPEQYDAYDAAGRKIAYLRLRHGIFRVDVPDNGGRTIHTAEPKGDGIFDVTERVRHLNDACRAIEDFYSGRQPAAAAAPIYQTADRPPDRILSTAEKDPVPLAAGNLHGRTATPPPRWEPPR